MNEEIEKKYLVKKIPKNLTEYKYYNIKQGYLSIEPTLRIRQKNDKYTFTFKGNGALKRVEFEHFLTKTEFNNLWKKIEFTPIIKKRYEIPIENNLIAELDIYEKELLGFYNVEVEFTSVSSAKNFIPPVWFGDEITYNRNYKNNNLAKFGKKYLHF